MPSNALKISQLIAELTNMQASHGDLDVVLAAPGLGEIVAIDGRNINVSSEAVGKQLPAPCVVIGHWRDERGALRNTPGQRYEADAVAGEWNYSRDDAPESVVVTVWKRYGGQDKGYRVGSRWYVWEGEEAPRRPIEIVPAGILAWKP